MVLNRQWLHAKKREKMELRRKGGNGRKKDSFIPHAVVLVMVGG